MSQSYFEYEKHIYELDLPEPGDRLLHLSIECPVFSGTQSKIAKINRFYVKREHRLENYYRNAVKKAANICEKELKRGRRIIYPSDIRYSFTITENTEDTISIFNETSVTSQGTVTKNYSAENWNCVGGYLFTLDDILPAQRKTQKALYGHLTDKCLKDENIADKKAITRRIRKYFSPENIYIKDGTVCLFYQPGKLLPKDKGVVVFPVNPEYISALALNKEARKSRLKKGKKLSVAEDKL